MKKVYLLLVAFVFVISGCNSKKYFEPQDIVGSIYPSGTISSSIKYTKRDGATLENGDVLVSDGVHHLNLEDGYFYVSNSEDYIFVTNAYGVLSIYDKKSNKLVKSINFHTKVLSANNDGDILSVVTMDNTAIIYDLSKNLQLLFHKEKVTNSLDTRVANPYFFKDLLLIPMLNGRIIVVDKYDAKVLKNINVDTSKDFANIIFFKIIDDTLVAATQNKIISMGSIDMNEKKMEIKDALFFENQIYILGKDGVISLLNDKLEVVKSSKFPFAVFIGTMYGTYIYALEKNGYVVAIDKHLITANVYNFGAIEDSKVVATGNKIYFDNKYFEVSK